MNFNIINKIYYKKICNVIMIEVIFNNFYNKSLNLFNFK